MMLPPGAIGVLRYVSTGISEGNQAKGCSYQEHDINDPGFLIGMALPLESSK